MDKNKQQTIWSAFVDGLLLTKPREWFREAFTHKSISGEEEQKRREEQEEQKRREEEELRKKAVEDFKVRCKAFGWWMATLLMIIFVGLTYLSLHFRDDHLFLQTIIIPVLKWVFGLGVVSYAVFNMLMTWEKYFRRYVNKHTGLFESPLEPIPLKQVCGFWFFMMSETMFWGWWSKIKVLWKNRSAIYSRRNHHT